MGITPKAVGTEYRYMDSVSQTDAHVPTGILTDGEREFLRGESDVEDPAAYRSNIRYRAKKRMSRIEEDLDVLREHGEEELVEEFFNRFGRVQRLEREIEALRAELENKE
jgi:hypothetical protein